MRYVSSIIQLNYNAVWGACKRQKLVVLQGGNEFCSDFMHVDVDSFTLAVSLSVFFFLNSPELGWICIHEYNARDFREICHP